MDEDTESKLKEFQRSETDEFSILILTSSDNLKAFIRCSPKELAEDQERVAVSPEQLLGLIDSKFKKDGIDHLVLSHCAEQLSSGQEVSTRRILKGTPAAPGKDGKVVLLVKPYRGVVARDENDFIDPRFLRLFDNIEKGLTVARIYPPKPGKDGVDVFGSVIKSDEGKPVKITPDKTIELMAPEEGQPFETLVSSEAGFLQIDGERYSIQTELALKADIDYHTGDIEFIGDIRISGNVKKNFTVKARGDINVSGDVIGATLISEQGSVNVKGDLSGVESESTSGAAHVTAAMVDEIIGKKRPHIRAANNFSARTVHGADIDVGYSVEISKELRETNLRCGGTVTLSNGHLVGGKTKTACGLEAGIIGTDGEATTFVELCSDVESTAEFRALAKELNSHEQAAQLLRLHLGTYSVLSIEAEAKLEQHHRSKLQALRKKLKEVESSYASLLEKKEHLLKDAKFNPSFRVNFKKLAHPGLSILAQGIHYTLAETTKGPKTIEFDRETSEFELAELRELQCVFEPQKTEKDK